MKAQPKYKPQQQSGLFSDKRSSRRPPEGTVALGQLNADDASHWGIVNTQYVGRNPLPITKELLAHGQNKFNVYCAPCHSQIGDGKGIVGVRAGAAFQPANLLEPRVKQMNDGELYSVASEGRRTMMGYRTKPPTKTDGPSSLTFAHSTARRAEPLKTFQIVFGRN